VGDATAGDVVPLVGTPMPEVGLLTRDAWGLAAIIGDDIVAEEHHMLDDFIFSCGTLRAEDDDDAAPVRDDAIGGATPGAS
jgi:hypothetical protein